MLHRQGSSIGGSTSTPRTSIDFLVDGSSLLSSLRKQLGWHTKFMRCIVKGSSEQNSLAVQKPALNAPADTRSGRVLLYTCPECGDIGCGAFAVKIDRAHDDFTWSEFAYENGYEKPRVIEALEPFTFPASGYVNAIHSAGAFWR